MRARTTSQRRQRRAKQQLQHDTGVIEGGGEVVVELVFAAGRDYLFVEAGGNVRGEFGGGRGWLFPAGGRGADALADVAKVGGGKHFDLGHG